MLKPALDFSEVDMTDPADWVQTEILFEEYPNIPPKTHRHLTRNRKTNGLAPACKKIGKYLYTNRKGYGFYLVNL